MTALAQRSPEADLLAFIDRVRDEPVWFAREVLRHKAIGNEPTIAQDPKRSWELDQFQIDLLEACADVWRKKIGKPTRINHEGKPFITVRSGRGPGKTHTLGLLAFWFNTAFPGRVIATAPKLAQLRTRVWTALRRIHGRAEKYWRSTHCIRPERVAWYHQNDAGKVVENEDWSIIAETASNPESMSGLHMPFQMILVEEATGIDEPMFVPIIGATGLELTIWVYVSNPTKITGTFANSHLQRREAANYFRYHINLANAARIDRAWVAALELKYGKDSPIVAISAHGEFPTSDPNQLVAVEWIDKALNKEFHTDGSLPHFRISIDVADGGENESVLTVGQHFQSVRRIRKQRAYNFPSSESPIRCADEGERAWKEYGCSAANGDFFVVDSLGVGAGTAGELMRRGYPVVCYKGGESSSNPAMWRNRRVQSYMVMRNEFRDGLLFFDEDFLESKDSGLAVSEMDDFMAQLCSIKTKHDAERVEDLLTKKEMVDMGIVSPDRSDSLAMQYATQAPRMETQAQGGGTSVTPHVARSRSREGFVHG